MIGVSFYGFTLHNWANSLFHIFVVFAFVWVCLLLEDIRDELRGKK